MPDRGKKVIEKKNIALETLNIEYVPIEAIQPNSYNPNRQNPHDFELLKLSMTEDGFTQPIICLNDGTIVDGEHRWRAARELNLKEVPVVRVNMSEVQAKIATLRHNRARGSEDYELSGQVLRDLVRLDATAWTQDSLQLSDSEMQRLLDDTPAPELLAGDEYSESWLPTRGSGSAETDQIASGHGTDSYKVGDVDHGMSANASDAIREREQRLRAARTEEERKIVERESHLYRLSLIFAGDEASLIRRVLGAQPAVKLRELCEEHDRRENPEYYVEAVSTAE